MLGGEGLTPVWGGLEPSREEASISKQGMSLAECCEVVARRSGCAMVSNVLDNNKVAVHIVVTSQEAVHHSDINGCLH